ncbi:MAG TPA: hypothetical protein VG325_08760 [Solirubrobacteraceae bacterium]|jgi:hypothetical protein|nr:hypothetical protein [Solirubrobacteraceae bacterium]
MDAAWLHRARWRWRGALLWPTFAVAVFVDGAIARFRPFVGDSQSFGGGILAGMVLNLLGVLLLSRLFGAAVHRWRADMPAQVARNYGGTLVVVLISAGMLAAGEVRHAAIISDQRVLDDAIVRAEAFIGDRAPAEFRANANHTDTFTIQTGVIYRTCVPSLYRPRYYCVIVKPRLPLAQSVVPAGGESNGLFSQGLG